MLLIPILVNAQDKVVEKSGRKPKWVNALEKDYIIVVGTGATIDLAQQQALMMIKESIVEAVAVNVKSQTNIRTEEVTNRSRVLSFLESFTSSTTSESAKVPFLQGITLAQAEGYYWEKLRAKDNSIRYAYHIRYPFPVVDMNRLAFEFKLRDEELTEKLERLSAEGYQPSSVEEIESIIGELRVLADYFKDGRKDLANLAIRRYNGMLGAIEITDAGSTLGTVKYHLKLGQSPITSVKKPILISGNARILNSNQDSRGVWSISYDYSECYPDMQNSVTVKYRFGGNNVDKVFYFDVLKSKVDIYISEAIVFNKEGAVNETINRYTADLTISSKSDASFTITKVVLELKGLPHLVIDHVGRSFSGKGVHNLALLFEKSIDAGKSSSFGKVVPKLNGMIHYINNNTGETGSFRILNQQYSTDW